MTDKNHTYGARVARRLLVVPTTSESGFCQHLVHMIAIVAAFLSYSGLNRAFINILKHELVLYYLLHMAQSHMELGHKLKTVGPNVQKIRLGILRAHFGQKEIPPSSFPTKR